MEAPLTTLPPVNEVGRLNDASFRAIGNGWSSRFHTEPVDLFLLREIEDFALAHLKIEACVGRSLLDIGCGEGRKTESFRRMGFEAYGVDIHEPTLQFAREHYPMVRFDCGDAQRLPYPDQIFDAVFSCSTMQYVDAKAMLAEALRVLRPGGRGIFIVNLDGNPLARTYRMLRRTDRYPPNMKPVRHLRLSELPHLLPSNASVTVRTYNLTNSLLHTLCMVHGTLTAQPKVVLHPVRTHSLLSKIDQHLLRWVRGFEQFCWSACVAIEKRQTP